MEKMTFVEAADLMISRLSGNAQPSPFSSAHPTISSESFQPNQSTKVCPGCWNPYSNSFFFNGLCPSCTNSRSVGTAPIAMERIETGHNSFMMNHMLHVLREEHNTNDSTDGKRCGSGICKDCGSNTDSLSYCSLRRGNYCTSCTAVYQYLDVRDSQYTSHEFSTPSSVLSSRQPEPKERDPELPEDCEHHLSEKLVYLCKTCCLLVCSKCISSGHKQHLYTTINDEYHIVAQNVDSLLHRTATEVGTLRRSVDAAERMQDQVLEMRKDAVSKVHQIFQAYKEAVMQKEKEIVGQIMAIGDLRLDGLTKERGNIESGLERIKQLTSSMKDANKQKIKVSLVLSHHQLLNEVNKQRKIEEPVEDASFTIHSNPSVAHNALTTLCTLTTAPFPPLCTAVGDGLYYPRINRLCTIVVYTKDRAGEPCQDGGKHLTVQIRAESDNSHTVPADIHDNQDGSCSITFRPRLKGEHSLVIAVRGHHIQGSPFTLSVCGGREYSRFGMVTSVFGSEGKGNGQFCRPWGICCDQHGNIIVGDRSNHRIQVFDCNGVFKHTFGTEGSRPGQFNRPAGVAINREGNIVVADKDNHRIQIFQIDGKFLSMFGSKGGNDGQMIYPYDVAVNRMDGRMAVTDTGNHRILIFNPDGQLLGKFGYKGYLCGHFDSPRGISFNDEGHIIISDFNVHHILVIHPEGTTAHILGSHGSGNGQFLRPQGIAVDHMGNFVVADTRNNRIVITYPNGQFIAKFGGSGSSPGQFDRPTSVCVLPDGRIAVVDFGNSRVQLF